MGLWETVYPDVGDPVIHKENKAINTVGDYFVMNVIFSQLGNNGVINLLSMDMYSLFNGPHLLVYRTTFIEPSKIIEGQEMQAAGGAILCMIGDCYQIGVCSTGAYCKMSGSHSSIASLSTNIMKACSITQSKGEDCDCIFGPKVGETKSVNHSFSNGGGMAVAQNSLTNEFITFHNISIISNQVGFRFVNSRNTFSNCVFSEITNLNSHDFIFQIDESGSAYFNDCIFVDNNATALFDPNSLNYFDFQRCYFYNPLIENNGDSKNVGVERFEFEMQMFSTELCAAENPIDLGVPDGEGEKEETLAVDRPNLILWYSIVKQII